MNFTYATANNVDLLARKDEQTTEGAAIRKELTRRKKVGLWIGPDVEVKVKQKQEIVSRVGQVRVL